MLQCAMEPEPDRREMKLATHEGDWSNGHEAQKHFPTPD